MAKKVKQIESIEDLVPDRANINKGTERGNAQLDWSLTNLGAWRSIAVSSDGVVAAGNQTLEQAAAHGFKIRPVHTKGDELVVVVRDDIASDDPRFRQYAVADNRISETNYVPDVEVLLSHAQSDVDLSPLYRDDEIEAYINSLRPEYELLADDEAERADEDSADQKRPSDSEKFAIPLVVDRHTLNRWNKYKETLGVMLDSIAFIELLDSIDAGNNE